MQTPEIQLLLLCVRRTADEAVAARIRAILSGDIDWTRLIGAALHHGTTALLYRTLRQTCPDAVPPELLDALRNHVEENAERAEALAEELLAIVADCEGRSVAVVPFKGPALALLAYGDVRLRTSIDLDLMVREADLPTIGAVLGARGYDRYDSPDPPLPDHLEAAYRRYQRELIFHRETDHAVVEPQWAITSRMLAFSIDYDAMWRRTELIGFSGRCIPGFALEDLLLLLCIHGSKHYWSELRWIADIGALIEARPEVDLAACLERACRQGCRRVVLLGLGLAQALLETRLPEAVRRQIGDDAVCRGLIAETIDLLGREDFEPPGAFDITAYRLRSRERFRDRVLCVWRTIVTPRVPHFSIVRLPPALSFLYYPIKLVHDYLLLPLWLVVKPLKGRSAEGQG